MLAERMAAGVAAGVYQIEHMAAVTFTRKAASELRGRFHLALESELAWLHRAPGQAAERSASRGCSRRSSNLERFFAGTIHSFCARLLRERPVESGVSPGFTELDEVQDLELRQRAWRDFITSARAAGDPDMMALLEADVRPKDLDSAFATICVNEDVEFPPGDAVCPDPKPAWKALEKFWKELQKHLPSTIDPDTTCQIQKAAQQFRGPVARRRRTGSIARRSSRRCSRRGTASRRSCRSGGRTSPAEKKRLLRIDQPLHASFPRGRRRAVSGAVAPVRLSAVGRRCSRARATCGRRRAPPSELAELRRPAQPHRARAARERRRPPRAAAEVPVSVRGRVPGHRSGAGRDRLLARGGRRTSRRRRARRVRRTGGSVPLRPGALFVVGDPKQSIYRFRRADIDIYNIVRAALQRSRRSGVCCR